MVYGISMDTDNYGYSVVTLTALHVYAGEQLWYMVYPWIQV